MTLPSTRLFDTLDQNQKLLTCLEALQDTQCAMLLLRFCALPKIVHLLRTISPEISLQYANQHDKSVLSTFTTFVKTDHLSDEDTLQAQLRIRDGGFGLLSMADTTGAAYVASVHTFVAKTDTMTPSLAPAIRQAVLDRKAFEGLEPAMQNLCKTKDSLATRHRDATFFQPPQQLTDILTPPTSSSSSYQRKLAYLSLQNKRDILYGRANNFELSRLLSLAQKGASAFLTVLPQDPERQIKASHFTQLCRTRLGLSLADLEITHCICKMPLDAVHLQTCQFSKAYRRHEAVVSQLCEAIRAAGFSPVTSDLPSLTAVSLSDPPAGTTGAAPVPATATPTAHTATTAATTTPSTTNSTNSNFTNSDADDGGDGQHDKHCGDIYVPNFFALGQGVMLDVTIANAQAQYCVQHPKAGEPTLKAEKRKHSKYDDMYKRVGITFVPIAFDSNGAIGKEADLFLKQLATKAVLRNPDMDWAGPALRAGWVQNISLIVQRELVRNMFDLASRCRGKQLDREAVFGLDTPATFARFMAEH